MSKMLKFKNIAVVVKKKKKLLILIFLIIIALIGGIIFFRARKRGTRMEGAVSKIQSATAQVSQIDSTVSGTGNISIGSITNIKAPVGLTVSEVYVESGDTVKKGQKLVKIDKLSVVNALLEAQGQLEDVEDELDEDDLSDLEEEKLEQEKESLEETIDTLEDLHDSPTIKASTAGTIGSITVSEGSEITKTASGGNNSSNSSTSATSTNGINISQMSYRSYCADKRADESSGIITRKTSSNSQMLLLSADTLMEESDFQEETQQVEQTMIIDYSDFSIEAPKKGEKPQSEITQTEAYSGSISWNAGSVFKANTEYTATIVLRAKENYYFSASSLPVISGAVYDWRIEDQTVLRMTAIFEKTESEPTTESTYTQQSTADNTASTTRTQNYSTEQQNGTYSSDGTQQGGAGTQSTVSTNITNSGNNSGTNYSGSSSGALSGVSSGTVANASGSSSVTSSGTTQTASGSNSNTSSESSNSIANNYESVIGTILVQDEASVIVSIDELDILDIKEGQTANITLDAVEDKEYEGEISKIATEATNSGGSAKYQVEISLPIDENMKSGMSASVTIHTAQAQDVVVIPVSALQEKENKTFVYTKTDEKGNLSGEVEVETGISDGTNVEITSGLSQGDIVYYTLPTSSSNSKEETMLGGGKNPFGSEGGGRRGNSGGGLAPTGGSPGGGGR